MNRIGIFSQSLLCCYVLGLYKRHREQTKSTVKKDPLPSTKLELVKCIYQRMHYNLKVGFVIPRLLGVLHCNVQTFLKENLGRVVW